MFYILYNSKVWHDATLEPIAKLESVEEDLLKSILKAHSRTPKECLYLQTGTIPLTWTIALKRMNNFKNIISRDESELIKNICLAQQENRTRRDFVNLAMKYLKYI